MCLVVIGSPNFFFFFFFNDTATTEIYTLSLHDALPISGAVGGARLLRELVQEQIQQPRLVDEPQLLVELDFGIEVHAGKKSMGLVVVTDRKSTRLNSSHLVISYAVFCLKKKKKRI